ncbi:hypothetical protein [Pseudovibrio sp. WM33]|uniref:hypothetical protein n=1 Tax=Pseudovibrio sp. WM33 TaxID=1735585 RepID=UPI0007AE57DD|nr:hypothetical protein [Pseudovibrio sp. WM33]KZL22379.1 hypothetical protein PsWM33_03977 [Pseudovibrio sp. WM33]
MPKSDLTPEQEKWTEKLLKHLNLKNVDEVQLEEMQSDTTEHSNRPNEVNPGRPAAWRSRVLVSKDSPAAHQQQAAQAAEQFKAEITQLSNRYQTLATNAQKLDAQARKQLVTKEHIEAFKVQVEKISNTFKQFNKNFSGQQRPDAGTISLLKTLLDKVQYHIGEGKKVLQQGCKHADAMIAKEMPAVEAYQNTVEDTYKHRDELTQWGVDTADFDKAHRIANLPLLRMQKAIADHSYPGLKFMLGKIAGKKEAFVKAYDDAKEQIDRNREDAQQRLDKTLADATALNKRSSELEHTPDKLTQFTASFEKVAAATPKGQQALGRDDYQGATAILHDNEGALFQMQQLWFSNASAADDQTDEPIEKGEPIPTHKKIQNLRRALEQAYERLPFIKASLPNAHQYEAECKSLKTLLTSAQSDLISGKVEDAEEKVLPLRKIRFQLYSLTHKAKEQVEWVERQLVQLQGDAKSWLDRHKDLKLISQSDEDAKQSFNAYEKEAENVKSHFDNAASHIENSKAIQAQKSVDEGMHSLKRLIAHASDIELD